MVPLAKHWNRLLEPTVSLQRRNVASCLEARLGMFNDDQVKMTGSIILSLIWTLLVSSVLFALAG